MAEVRVASLLKQLIRGHLQKVTDSEDARRAEDDALRFAQRVLSSKLAAFSATETATLVQQLQRQLLRSGQRQSAVRLAEASQKLTKVGVDERAILALLAQLYESSKDQAFHLNSVASAMPPLQDPGRLFQTGTDRPVSSTNGGVSASHTAPAKAQAAAEESTSTVLVREVLSACQAISGQHVTVALEDDAETKIDPGIGIPLPERQLMMKLAELGWLFKKLRDHSSAKREVHNEGAVRQAFRASLRQELSDFYRLLATLETQAGNPIPEGRNSQDPAPPYLTLRRLLVWLSDPLVRLRWLASVADSVTSLSGGRLLAALESAAAHGQPLVRDALRRCLKQAAVPYLSQIWLWVFHGRLQPLPGENLEFFIVSNREGTIGGAPGHGKMWREGYRLEDAMRSPFISEALAQRILRAGKSLNFLRECCGDTEWTQQASRTAIASEASNLQYDQKEELEAVATRAGTDIDRHVVQTLLDKFQLGAHCEAIKRYLLLGQGDFIEALMDNVGSELAKPARDISEFALNGNLDAALRGSSAQYDAADQINRLRIKLETSQMNDEGWDVFTLKYEVEEPIGTVLDQEAMKSYLRVFKLLWALKRAEHSLNNCWVELNSVQRQLTAFPSHVKRSGAEAYSMEKVWEELRQYHRLRNEMAHLVSSLQAYIMFEVVEAAWNAFMARLRSTQDLDGLVQAHEEYLQTLLRRTLLEDIDALSASSRRKQATRPDVQQELRTLLQQTLELRPKIRLLADTVGAACFKARMHVQSGVAAAARGQWGRQGGKAPILGVVPEELERIHSSLDALDRSYGEQLGKFVGLLPTAADVDLRFLLFRLKAGGKGRTTEDGSRSRHTEDGSVRHSLT